MVHKKSTPQVHDSYELQPMNLDTIYEHLRQFKGTKHFQKKENSSNIRKVECYNCDIKEHYARDCYKIKKSQNLTAIRCEPERTK